MAYYPTLPTIIPQITNSGDDYPALSAAIAKAISSGINHVTLPPQTNPIITGSTLQIPSEFSLYIPRGAILKLKDSANVDLIRNSDQVGGNTGITIYGGGVLDGNKANQVADLGKRGIYLYYIQDVDIRDINIKNVSGTACEIDGAGQLIGPGCVHNLRMKDCTYYGLWVEHALRRMQLSDCYAENCGASGFYLDASELTVNGAVAKGCGTGGSPDAGIHIRNITNASLVGLKAYLCQRQGILVDGLRHSSGASWVSQMNSRATSNTWDDIEFSANSITGGAGYGETTDISISGIQAGANPQLDGVTTVARERYCISIASAVMNDVVLTGIQYGQAVTGQTLIPQGWGGRIIDHAYTGT